MILRLIPIRSSWFQNMFQTNRLRAEAPAKGRISAFMAWKREITIVLQLTADHFEASGRKKLSFYSAKTFSLCRSLWKTTKCECNRQRTTEEGLIIVHKRTRFWKKTSMGFCILYWRIQIHSREQLKSICWNEEKQHQVPSIQHFERRSYWGGVTIVWTWNLNRRSHWPACILWRNYDWCAGSFIYMSAHMLVLLVTISFWWVIWHNLPELRSLRITLTSAVTVTVWSKWNG